MRYSDINTKCVYNLIFDPVHPCEFNGKHLALVLKKNNDNKTCIVMPLTSSSNGVGENKERIIVNSLPSSLSSNPTYAVYNQIRTVNADRFIRLKEGRTPVEASVDSETLNLLFKLMIRDLTHDIADKRMLLFSNLLNYERFIKARSIAYCIKNSKISNIEEARDDIYQLLNGISIDYEASDINNGIDKIIESSISKRFEEIAINKSE